MGELSCFCTFFERNLCRLKEKVFRHSWLKLYGTSSCFSWGFSKRLLLCVREVVFSPTKGFDPGPVSCVPCSVNQRAERPRTLTLLSTLLQEKNSIRTDIVSIYSKFCYSQSAADFIQELTRTPSCKGWSGGMSNVGRFVYKSFDIYLRWIVEVGGEIAPGWFFVLQQCVFIPSHLHRMQKMRHFRATRRQWNVEPYLNWRGLPGKWKNSLSFSMRSNCLPVTVHRKVEKHGECGGPKANLFDFTPRRLLNFQRFPCGAQPTGLLRGICPPCQSRGWGICKVCTPEGLAFTNPGAIPKLLTCQQFPITI